MPAVMKRPHFITKDSALARVQAASPSFRALLVQPFVLSALLPGWAIPLGLTLATPDLAGQSEVAFCNPNPNPEKERTPYEHQSRYSLRLHR